MEQIGNLLFPAVCHKIKEPSISSPADKRSIHFVNYMIPESSKRIIVIWNAHADIGRIDEPFYIQAVLTADKISLFTVVPTRTVSSITSGVQIIFGRSESMIPFARRLILSFILTTCCRSHC